MTRTGPLEFTVQRGNRHINRMFHHRGGVIPEGSTGGLGTEGAPHGTGEVREGFLGMVPPTASPLTCTIPEILLEGCQEPCLLAAPASQSPLLPDAVSAEPNASSATPQPHPAPHPTLQDSCRSLPSLAGSAKRPTQNSCVRASLGTATQPQVPQPSQSSCGSCHPGLSLNTGRVPPISSFAQKKVTFFQVASWELWRVLPLLPLTRIRQTPECEGWGGSLGGQGYRGKGHALLGFQLSAGAPPKSSAPNAPLGRERREAPGDTCWGHSC